MSWWIWVLAGFALLAIEMASTTMHVGFFGLGAFVEGLLVALHIGGPLWAQILTFTVVSLVALFLIRPIVMKKMGLNFTPVVDSLIGESAVALDSIAASSLGRAEMRGSTWTARNIGIADLSPGQRARVERVLYFKILDPGRASYGITDYNYAIQQLAQTNLRSEIGKIELDKTFEERTNINLAVVSEVDKASEAWGVKVLRYEIKNITPPQGVLAAMEKQMRAEREKRALILQSEGQRDAAINNAEGDKQQVIKASEAKKQQNINEAEGQSAAIMSVAKATAEGIRQVAEAIGTPGGRDAMQLRLAEEYIKQFGLLAKSGTSMIVPATISDVSSMIAMATGILKQPAVVSAEPKLSPRASA